MTGDRGYPGGRSELEFLDDYDASTLRKPQVVADSLLQSLFLADRGYRQSLAIAILEELVEAARRLNAVWVALTDRSRPVGRRLLEPLPGAADWAAFAAVAQDAPPEQLLRAMTLDDSLLETVEELSAFPALAWYGALVRAFEAGPPAWLAGEPEEAARAPLQLFGVSRDAAGELIEISLQLTEDDLVALGDAAGDLSRIARDLLHGYVDGRQASLDRAAELERDSR